MKEVPEIRLDGIRLKLFGAFRGSGNAHEFFLPLERKISVSTLKPLLAEKLGPLVFDSALADESRILLEDEWVSPGQSLAILPPVCGG